MAVAQQIPLAHRCITSVGQVVDAGFRLNLVGKMSSFAPSRSLRYKHFAPTRKQASPNLISGPVASIPDYGLPDYGISKVPSPTEPKSSEGSGVAESPLVTKFWDYGTPRPYTTPSSYTTPGIYTTPNSYGPEAGGTDGAAPPANGGRGGGGGGGGGGEGGGGSEPGDHSPKKKLSPSQIITLVYAALVAGGGLIGYLKKGSAKSGTAGMLTGAALLAVFYLLPGAPLLASILGLVISASLLSVMGTRFASSKKFMPSGLVALMSLIMTGGYIHGIVRTH